MKVLFEQIFDNNKIVIIEIADIFLHQNKFEEIPDETLQPEEYKEWEKTEARSRRAVITKQLKRAKAEGYTHWKLFTAEEAKEHGQSLGLNGMYLLAFMKKDAAATVQTVVIPGCDASLTCQECKVPSGECTEQDPEVETARKVGQIKEMLIQNAKTKR